MNQPTKKFTWKLGRDQLESLLGKTIWNEGFGCYTRSGFENVVWPQVREDARWIIYFDIDGMHELNEKHGSYESVDAMIKEVFSAVRSSDYVAGQWKSGDEFLVVLTEKPGRRPIKPEGMVERLIQEFAKQGMSATFEVRSAISRNLAANVRPAADAVAATKKLRGRTR